MNFHKIKGEGDTIVLSPIGHLIDSNDVLVPGVYEALNVSKNPMEIQLGFNPLKEGDSLIKFSDGMAKKVLEKLDKFFSKEVKEKYKTLQLMHKMGVVISGKPGVGKTILARLIMAEAAIKYGAIGLDITGWGVEYFSFIIKSLRKYQESPIILFYDEFEEIGGNNKLLTFLDGAKSSDGVIFMGCTNFPKQIPKRIIDRKSRIKHVFNVTTLPSIVYKEYISKKLPGLEKEVLDEYVYKALEAELTIDQLKNSIIDYYIDGATIDKAIAAASKEIGDSPKEGEAEVEF